MLLFKQWRWTNGMKKEAERLVKPVQHSWNKISTRTKKRQWRQGKEESFAIESACLCYEIEKMSRTTVRLRISKGIIKHHWDCKGEQDYMNGIQRGEFWTETSNRHSWKEKGDPYPLFCFCFFTNHLFPEYAYEMPSGIILVIHLP